MSSTIGTSSTSSTSSTSRTRRGPLVVALALLATSMIAVTPAHAALEPDDPLIGAWLPQDQAIPLFEFTSSGERREDYAPAYRAMCDGVARRADIALSGTSDAGATRTYAVGLERGTSNGPPGSYSCRPDPWEPSDEEFTLTAAGDGWLLEDPNFGSYVKVGAEPPIDEPSPEPTPEPTPTDEPPAELDGTWVTDWTSRSGDGVGDIGLTSSLAAGVIEFSSPQTATTVASFNDFFDFAHDSSDLWDPGVTVFSGMEHTGGQDFGGSREDGLIDLDRTTVDGATVLEPAIVTPADTTVTLADEDGDGVHHTLTDTVTPDVTWRRVVTECDSGSYLSTHRIGQLGAQLDESDAASFTDDPCGFLDGELDGLWVTADGDVTEIADGAMLLVQRGDAASGLGSPGDVIYPTLERAVRDDVLTGERVLGIEGDESADGMLILSNDRQSIADLSHGALRTDGQFGSDTYERVVAECENGTFPTAADVESAREEAGTDQAVRDAIDADPCLALAMPSQVEPSSPPALDPEPVEFAGPPELEGGFFPGRWSQELLGNDCSRFEFSYELGHPVFGLGGNTADVTATVTGCARRTTVDDPLNPIDAGTQWVVTGPGGTIGSEPTVVVQAGQYGRGDQFIYSVTTAGNGGFIPGTGAHVPYDGYTRGAWEGWIGLNIRTFANVILFPPEGVPLPGGGGTIDSDAGIVEKLPAIPYWRFEN